MTTTVCHGVRDPEKRVTSFLDRSQRFVCKCYNKAALKCDPLGEINGWIYWVELNRFTDRRIPYYYIYYYHIYVFQICRLTYCCPSLVFPLYAAMSVWIKHYFRPESQPSQRDDRGGHRRVVMHCLGCCSGSSAFWSSHRQATRSGGSTIDTAHRHHSPHHKELQFQSEPEPLRVFQLKILVT